MRKRRWELIGTATVACALLCGVVGCERKPPNVPPPSEPQVEEQINEDGSMNAGADPANK